MHLKGRFHTVSRSAQMKVFRQLLNIRVTPESPSASLYKIVNLIEEMNILNVRFDSDELAGFILQAATDTSSELHTEFERRIEIDMVQNGPKADSWSLQALDVPTFNRLIQHFDAVRSLIGHRADNDTSVKKSPFAMAANLKEESGQREHLCDEADLNPEEIDTNAFQGPRGRQNYFPRPNPLYHNFQPFYPMIVPTGHRPLYPQVLPPEQRDPTWN